MWQVTCMLSWSHTMNVVWSNNSGGKMWVCGHRALYITINSLWGANSILDETYIFTGMVIFYNKSFSKGYSQIP